MGKKLVAARDLPAGHVLEGADVVAKSPGDGLPPYELDRVLGCTLAKPLQADEPITFELLEDAPAPLPSSAGPRRMRPDASARGHGRRRHRGPGNLGPVWPARCRGGSRRRRPRPAEDGRSPRRATSPTGRRSNAPATSCAGEDRVRRTCSSTTPASTSRRTPAGSTIAIEDIPPPSFRAHARRQPPGRLPRHAGVRLARWATAGAGRS